MRSVRFLEHYDGLLFVEWTTRARPNPALPLPAEEKAKQGAW